MRTVLALLLLAVASQAYTVKMGGLKGSWATNVPVMGPDTDQLAPTVSNFMIEDAAEDYMYNLSDPSGTMYPDVTWTGADDASSVDAWFMCTVSFTLWDSTGTMEIAWLPVTYATDEDYAYAAIYSLIAQGDYVGGLECMDNAGNWAWWDSNGSPTAIYSIMVSNHEADMTAPELDAASFKVDGANSQTYTVSDAGSSDYFTVNIDFDSGAGTDPFDYSDISTAWFMGTWFNSMTGVTTDMSWEATYCSYSDSGYCSYDFYFTNYSELGIYTITSVWVGDEGGNWSQQTGVLTISVVEDPLHTATVVSCQTVVLTDAPDASGYYADVTNSGDSFAITLGCVIKSDLIAAWIYISVGYARDQFMQMTTNGVSTTMAGEFGAWNDATDFLSSDGTAITYIDIADGAPMGPYRLDTLSTTTSYGATQLYDFTYGAASSVAPSVVVALVAVAAALLRL